MIAIKKKQKQRKTLHPHTHITMSFAHTSSESGVQTYSQNVYIRKPHTHTSPENIVYISQSYWHKPKLSHIYIWVCISVVYTLHLYLLHDDMHPYTNSCTPSAPLKCWIWLTHQRHQSGWFMYAVCLCKCVSGLLRFRTRPISYFCPQPQLPNFLHCEPL